MTFFLVFFIWNRATGRCHKTLHGGKHEPITGTMMHGILYQTHLFHASIAVCGIPSERETKVSGNHLVSSHVYNYPGVQLPRGFSHGPYGSNTHQHGGEDEGNGKREAINVRQWVFTLQLLRAVDWFLTLDYFID